MPAVDGSISVEPLIAAITGLKPLSRDVGAATFGLETKIVLYSIKTKAYR